MNLNIDYIPFARPVLGKEEEEAALRVLRSGWLTSSREAIAFEEEFAQKVQAPHALAVNSATAALHLGLEALKVGRGDKVITTPYTFTATAETARYLGAEVLFADIEKDSWNIDPREVEKILAREKPGSVKAIIPVHIGGQLCRMQALKELAKQYNTALLEDAAHCFPVQTPDGFAGTLGDAGAFSFYANKTITTGEGGMLVTRNPELAERVKIMRLHGIDRSIWSRYTGKNAQWQYQVIEAGYKYNLPDLPAAIGRAQLKKADRFLRERTLLARRYQDAFCGNRVLTCPPESPWHAWHLYILQLNLSLLRINRNEFIEKLSQQGIGCSVHYIPLHMMPYYQKQKQYKPEDFPRSFLAFRRSLSLPLYPGLSKLQQDYIINQVLDLAETYS